MRLRTLAVVAATTLMSVVAIQPARATPGAEDWVARLPTAGYPVDEVDGIAVSPDGARVFVAGSFGHFAGASIEVVAYDAAGAELWSAHYRGPGPYDDEVGGIAVSPDGSMVYVAGTSSTDSTKRDYITFAFDSKTGTRVWQKRYSSPVGSSFDAAAALAVSPDGSSVFVSGFSLSTPALTSSRSRTVPAQAPSCGTPATTDPSAATIRPTRWRSAQTGRPYM